MRGRLLRVPEAAMRLGLKESTVRRMILDKKVDVIRIGRTVSIPENFIENLIQTNYHKGGVTHGD